MFSPAAQHLVKTRACLANTKKPIPLGKARHQNPYPLSEASRLVLAQFKTDQSRLSSIRSLSQRAAAKKGLLGQYHEWIDGFLEMDVPLSEEEQEAFVWLLIWHMDSQVWSKVVAMAAYAIRHELMEPEGFKRSLPEVIIEQVAEGGSKQLVVCAGILDELAGVVGDLDLNDLIAAKCYKVRGLAQLDNDPEQAQCLLKQALELDDRCGVKRHLQRLQKQQAQTQQQPSEDLAAKTYTLSARACSRLLGISAPTFMKLVKQYPEQLPYVLIPNITRNLYRFNPQDIEAFRTQHLIKKTR